MALEWRILKDIHDEKIKTKEDLENAKEKYAKIRLIKDLKQLEAENGQA